MRIPTKGSLKETNLIAVLIDSADNLITGMVRAESGAAIKVVYLQQGTIAYASSNDRADRLTEVLRRAGKLTQEQIEHAQERVKPGISLGKTLVELGFLTPKELLWGAKLQVEGIIHQLLFWKEGSYQVLQGPLPKEIVSLNLNVYQVIFSGIMKTNDRRWVLEQIGTPEAVYGLSEEFHLKNASYRLPIESVVSRINGKRTINEIAHSSAVDAFEVSKTIAALEILGMAKRPKERPIQMPLIAGKPSTVEKLPTPEEKTHPTPEVSLGQVLQIPTVEQLQSEPSENPAEFVPHETKLPESKAEEQELEATAQEDLEEEPLSDKGMESNHVVFVPLHASDQSRFGIFGMSPHRSILLICAAVLLGILIFIFLFYLLNNNSETGHGNPSVQVNPVPIAKPKPQPPQPSPKVEAPSPLTLAGSGKLPEAASLWKTSLSEEKNNYTLQLILTCQPKTVQDLIQALGNSENIKILPADYQGQGCYRVVYGIYDSPESAAVAIPGLPQSFAGRRIQARIVLISKLLQ